MINHRSVGHAFRLPGPFYRKVRTAFESRPPARAREHIRGSLRFCCPRMFPTLRAQLPIHVSERSKLADQAGGTGDRRAPARIEIAAPKQIGR